MLPAATSLFAAQQPIAAPSAPPGTPVLIARGEGDEHGTPLQIGSADVQVVIAGFLARTTTTLTFENATSRTLEGELVFPLPEGATISGYGLDVEGEIVDAMVVEAQAARIAFEEEVRRGIDPGLMEWVRGNSFRTRVWPIPAQGRRTVRVEYVSELARDHDGVVVYQLPLHYSLPLPDLALRIEVLDGSAKPKLQASRLANVSFSTWEGRLVASARLHNEPLSDEIRISIPRVEHEPALVETHGDGRTYFAIDDLVTLPPGPAVAKPGRVGLLWDASLSHAAADAKRELEVVKAWLASLGDVEVVLTAFRNVAEPPQTLAVRGGDPAPVLGALEREPRDGGTSLDALRPWPGVAYYVLVSDGFSNIGRRLPEGLGAPIYAFTASTRADHPLLRHLARKSGGRYIPLGALASDEAAARIGHPPPVTMRVEYDRSALADVLPSEAEPIDGRVTVTGRLLAAEAQLTLHYRAASGAASERRFTIRQAGATASGLVPRFWAERKTSELSVTPNRNGDELVALGKTFGIVTPGTSLLVLETLDQYLRHGIEPPVTRGELRAEYLRQLAERKQIATRTRADKLERVATLWRDRIAWWESLPKGPIPSKPRVQPPATPSTQGPAPAPTTPQAQTPRPAECPGEASIQGRVTDVSGAALPGARVTATASTGAAVVVETDSNGGYGLCNLSPGQYVILVSLPGFKSWQGRLRLPLTRALTVRLEVSDLAETITVTAEEPSVETHRAATMGEQPGSGAPTIAIKPWDPETPYLAAMKTAGAQRAYASYLTERERYATSPSFYLDCAEYFLASGDRAIGLRVLTGILDLKLEDPRLLRVVAHRLQQLREFDHAIELFEQVLRLRPEEPQSLRDLALAFADRADAAREARRPLAEIAPDYLRALELLDELVLGEWDGRFPDIETVALMDANRLLAIMERDGIPGVERVTLDPRLRHALDLDIRIVLTWDTDETDMDLWVTEPSGEKCDYAHPRTAIGGMISRDFTAGYGPEEYLLRRAYAGRYGVQANFFGSHAQSLIGPTTAQATVISDFGRPGETRRTLTLRLTDETEVVDIGSVAFESTGDKR
jgi:tetratricopeptide (TPR) repeat protein